MSVNGEENADCWSLIMLDSIASCMMLNNFLTFSEDKYLLMILIITEASF